MYSANAQQGLEHPTSDEMRVMKRMKIISLMKKSILFTWSGMALSSLDLSLKDKFLKVMYNLTEVSTNPFKLPNNP